MKNILAAALLGFFLLPACKESEKKAKQKITDDYKKGAAENKPGQENDPGEFSISAPKGWTKTDTIMMGQRIVIIKSSREDVSDNFLENVNVVTEKIGNMGMDEYMSKSITNLENGLTGFEQGKTSDRNINGLEFKRLTYSHGYGGTPIDVETYFTLRNGTAYVITCSAKGGTISGWEQEFEEIIRSFKLN